jgi:hypothetical protein
MSSIKVLVAQPVNPKVNSSLWEENANKIFKSLTFENKAQGMFKEKVSAEGGPFARHARVRNELIDKYLEDDITHVLWFDSDIVEWPDNIIESLLGVSAKDIVAPYVYIEDNEWWNFKRFYDISCFKDSLGTNFNFKAPYNLFSGDKTSYVSCVGTAFIVPAYLHRKIRYDPYYDSNEHIFFFNKAQEHGARIIATPDIDVRHAFLPKYGESFH